jgi:hypothetical protein
MTPISGCLRSPRVEDNSTFNSPENDARSSRDALQDAHTNQKSQEIFSMQPQPLGWYRLAVFTGFFLASGVGRKKNKNKTNRATWVVANEA